MACTISTVAVIDEHALADGAPFHRLIDFDKDLRFPSYVSESFKSFVRAALAPVPSLRPTLVELIMHPWFDTLVEADELSLIIVVRE